MPCGGISPSAFGVPNEQIECWNCPDEILPNKGLFVEEWDAWIHVYCLPDFLKEDEGKVVLEHFHGIYIPEGYPANGDTFHEEAKAKQANLDYNPSLTLLNTALKSLKDLENIVREYKLEEDEVHHMPGGDSQGNEPS